MFFFCWGGGKELGTTEPTEVVTFCEFCEAMEAMEEMPWSHVTCLLAITWQVNGMQVIRLNNSYQKIHVQWSIFDLLMSFKISVMDTMSIYCNIPVYLNYYNMLDFPQTRGIPYKMDP